MAKYYKSIEEYLKVAQKSVDKALESKEVEQLAKETMFASIHNVVYASYEPKNYKRRSDKPFQSAFGTDGLGDPNNIIKSQAKNGVIEFTNEANFKLGRAGGMDASKSLAENIIDGYGDAPWSIARDFISDAEEHVPYDEIENIIIEELKKEGF